MKILIINGSPRKQGHISKMLQLMEKGGTKQHPGLTEREMKRCRRVIHKL